VNEEKTLKELPAPKRKVNNYKRVKVNLRNHPEAKVREVARALHISNPTASKWMSQVKEERVQKAS
jgi:Mn-dependent DtxR family transcriptional regulator